MAIAYPDWLPLAQKSKTPKPDTGFRTDLPQVGAPIFQKLTDDLKTGFSLTWVFTMAEHRAFMQWLRSPNYLDNCNQWFLMPVGIGSGAYGEPEMQELHFIAWPTWSQTGSVFTWSGDVVTRKLNNSDDDYDDIVIELPPPWASFLDIIVTGYPDNRDPETLPRSPIAWFNYRDNNLGYGLQFARGSAATYVKSGALISAVVNDPRFEDEGLLIEEGKSNIVPQSQSGSQFGAGNPTYQTLTNNISGILPFIGQRVVFANLPTPSATNDSLVQYNIGKINKGMRYSLSIFLKIEASQSLETPEWYLDFYSPGGGVVNRVRAIADRLSGGVYRVSTTYTKGGTVETDDLYFRVITPSRKNCTIVFGGAQVEVSTRPTSYIHTSGAAATRKPDQLSLTETGGKYIYREYIPLGSSSLIKELIPYAGELVPLNSHLRILKAWDRELTNDEKAALGV